MALSTIRLEGKGGIRMHNLRVYLDDKEITHMVRDLDLHIGIDSPPTVQIELVGYVSFGDGLELKAVVEDARHPEP